MKRISNLYERICSIENLMLADDRASEGKLGQYGVQQHLKKREANIMLLHHMLKDKTYRTSNYTTFAVFEPKERLIFRLPYFPDRICHHAVMNIMEPVWRRSFTRDTYSCIKERGIHGAAEAIRRSLRDNENTGYCLKLDVKKFYPSIDHAILKDVLRHKIKDQDLLWLLDNIIDSARGLPIGNYLSQTFANLYLTGLDHWLKEQLRVRYYFRYCDDMVILDGSKERLHAIRHRIQTYLSENLRLTMKDNYQVFPVAARGIDFVGYRFFHTHTLIRKSIKQAFFRKMSRKPCLKTFASYYGWLTHCDGKNLIKKVFYEKVSGTRDQARIQAIFRRKNKNIQNIEQRNYSACIQDREIKI
jgi:RNA-directed DNA polymerase